MRGIKTPQQDFALKMQGGLIRKGGHICGTLRYVYASRGHSANANPLFALILEPTNHSWHNNYTQLYGTIIIRLTHANVWESMGKPCSCMQFIKSRIFYCKSRENPYQYYKSRENPYQVLQVTRAASEHTMKSKVRMIKSLSP